MHHDNSNNTRNIKYKENEKLLLLPSLLLIIYIYMYIQATPGEGAAEAWGPDPLGPQRPQFI